MYFNQGSTPYASLAVRNAASDESDLLVAEVDLKYVTDLIASMQFADHARAYVIDGADRLVAHPDAALLHRNVSLASLPQVLTARSNRLAGASHVRDTWTVGASAFRRAWRRITVRSS